MILQAIHYEAIQLIVSGKQKSLIAKQIKVHPGTIYKWEQDEDFQLALQKTFSNIYGESINKLASTALRAAQELEDIICDAEAPTKYKLQAISLVLTHGEKVKNYQLETRLEQLEKLSLNEVNDGENIHNSIESD